MMKTRHVLGRRTTMHWDVAGIIINHVWAKHSVMRGHLAGGRTKSRCTVGDVVRLPALLFDTSCSREVTSDSRQVGEALCQTSSFLPVRDIELDLDRICCLLIVRRNLDHNAGLKDRTTET